MRCPILSELPAPSSETHGWPWTTETPPLPATRPDGSQWPRISIVTPSFNQGKYIEETIRSILLQGYPDIEYVVIDGGSTDGSVETIKKYERWLTHWISEKDRGQPNAINKGVRLCTGEVFNWINSDDSLLPAALAVIGEKNTDDQITAAAVMNLDGDRSEVIRTKRLSAKDVLLGDAIFHQPGIWLRRKELLDLGCVEETLQYVFDYHMYARYLLSHPSVKYSEQPIARFRLHEESKTCALGPLFETDRTAALRKILAEPSLKALHRFCRLRLRRDPWSCRIARIREGSQSRWRKATQLVGEALRDPPARFTRFTLGAIRRSLVD